MKKNLIGWTLLAALFLHCGSDKKQDIIGVYYRSTAAYEDNEIVKNLSQTAFANNFATFIKGYDKNPELSMIKRFNDKGVRYLILEDHDLKNIRALFRYTQYRKIRLSLVTSSTTSQADAVYLTDYRGLGRETVNQVFTYSRAKRSVFVIYFSREHEEPYWKREVRQGYGDFFARTQGLFITNTVYSRTNSSAIRQDMASFINMFQDNFRGILTDDDRIARKIILYLKSVGRDGEIQAGGFGATMDGMNTIIKIGFCMTGDMDRYGLFNTAVTDVFRSTGLFSGEERHRHRLLPGVVYNQFNILENLALTRKYSIQQLIGNK